MPQTLTNEKEVDAFCDQRMTRLEFKRYGNTFTKLFIHCLIVWLLFSLSFLSRQGFLCSLGDLAFNIKPMLAFYV